MNLAQVLSQVLTHGNVLAVPLVLLAGVVAGLNPCCVALYPAAAVMYCGTKSADASCGTPVTLKQREGLRTLSDRDTLGKIVDDVIAANPKQAEQYRGGKKAVIGFLVGQVMKASRGQADPAAVNELLESKLD